MRCSRRLILFTISTAALIFFALRVPPPAQASTARVRTLRDVSGPSPFPADECGQVTGQCSTTLTKFCKTDSDCALPLCSSCMAGETCISEHGSEFEPDIAVNPVHPGNLIAVYSQDAQDDTVASASRDGGRHWTQVVVPGLTKCSTGGTNDGGAGDPSVAIGPDGIAYTSSIVADSSGSASVLVNTSTDGGFSWSDPVTVVQDQSGAIDGPTVRADPTRAATAYLTWTRALVVLTFSRTTDGGATWTSPTTIPVEPDPVAMTGPNGGRIQVLPDGTLVDIFIQVHAGAVGPTSVWVVRSQDQGVSWSSPIRVVKKDIPANVVTDPDSPPDNPKAIGRGISFALPRMAVGADGTLYVVWHLIESICTGGPNANAACTAASECPMGSCSHTSKSQIQFVKSVNGGVDWTDPPAPVADEPTQAFLPTVAVSPAGTVGVTYFDFRNDVLGDQELTTDLWFRHSHDGGATWSETHVAGPFDLRPAPSPGVYPLGDYFGLAPIRKNGFGALWIQTIPPQGEGNTDAFFARIKVSPRQ